MLPTKFRIFWQSGFREDFKKSTNQKQELPVAATFVNGAGRNQHSSQRTAHRCFLPSFDTFNQAVSEEKIFRNGPIRNKNCLWRPCLYMVCTWIGTKLALFIEDRPQILPTNFGSFGQAVSEEKNFKNQPIRNKSRLWQTCLLTDREEINNVYRGPSIDASYEVSVHLTKWFQRRRFLKICVEINTF